MMTIFYNFFHFCTFLCILYISAFLIPLHNSIPLLHKKSVQNRHTFFTFYTTLLTVFILIQVAGIIPIPLDGLIAFTI